MTTHLSVWVFINYVIHKVRLLNFAFDRWEHFENFIAQVNFISITIFICLQCNFQMIYRKKCFILK